MSDKLQFVVTSLCWSQRVVRQTEVRRTSHPSEIFWLDSGSKPRL